MSVVPSSIVAGNLQSWINNVKKRRLAVGGVAIGGTARALPCPDGVFRAAATPSERGVEVPPKLARSLLAASSSAASGARPWAKVPNAVLNVDRQSLAANWRWRGSLARRHRQIAERATERSLKVPMNRKMEKRDVRLQPHCQSTSHRSDRRVRRRPAPLTARKRVWHNPRLRSRPVPPAVEGRAGTSHRGARRV